MEPSTKQFVFYHSISKMEYPIFTTKLRNIHNSYIIFNDINVLSQYRHQFLSDPSTTGEFIEERLIWFLSRDQNQDVFVHDAIYYLQRFFDPINRRLILISDIDLILDNLSEKLHKLYNNPQLNYETLDYYTYEEETEDLEAI